MDAKTYAMRVLCGGRAGTKSARYQTVGFIGESEVINWLLIQENAAKARAFTVIFSEVN
jgi:hypothetical protein